MPHKVRDGGTCPTGLGRGEHALRGDLGQVRLAINTLLVKGKMAVCDSTIRQTDIVGETILGEPPLAKCPIYKRTWYHGTVLDRE